MNPYSRRKIPRLCRVVREPSEPGKWRIQKKSRHAKRPKKILVKALPQRLLNIVY